MLSTSLGFPHNFRDYGCSSNKPFTRVLRQLAVEQGMVGTAEGVEEAESEVMRGWRGHDLMSQYL